MRDITIELTESFRIAFSQIRAHKMRSILTALGVIIGIIAVTLMGSAISGIEIGFERSLAVIGDDILYVEKWPWHNVDDWWNYRNRRRIEPQYSDTLKQLVKGTQLKIVQVQQYNSAGADVVTQVNSLANTNADVFVLGGALFGGLGSALLTNSELITRILGVLTIVLGLAFQFFARALPV